MSYGKPESGAKQASPLGQLLIMLREDLMGELQAINQYQAHIDNIEEEEIRDLLEHIRDDEKEHVAELTHLISRVDAIQREKFLNDHTAAPADRVNAGSDESQVLTVGNLFGKK